jgi:hypothetical protein
MNHTTETIATAGHELAPFRRRRERRRRGRVGVSPGPVRPVAVTHTRWHSRLRRISRPRSHLTPLRCAQDRDGGVQIGSNVR